MLGVCALTHLELLMLVCMCTNTSRAPDVGCVRTNTSRAPDVGRMRTNTSRAPDLGVCALNILS